MNVLDDADIRQLAEMFRLMGEPNRLLIILAVRDQAKSVGRIAEELGQSPSLISHHLRLLRAARILRAERRGKHVYYSAADQHVERVIADMTEHVGEPEARDPEVYG